MQTRAGVLLVVAVATLLLPVTAAAEDVDCGDTITGAVTVTGGTVTAGACGGDPVLHLMGRALLDLNGHSISCSLASAAGVRLSGGGNVLRNGTIEGCLVGVEVGGDGGHLLSDIVVRDNTDHGIAGDSDVGGNTLLRVHAANNGQIGIWLRGDRNRVVDGVVVGNPRGLSIVGELNVVDRAVASRASGAPDFSIGVFGSRNVVRNSIAANGDVGSHGFFFDGDGAKIVGNQSVGNGGAGFVIRGVDHTVVSNLAASNVESGFQVDLADGVRLIRNVAIGNGGSGAAIARVSGGTGDGIRNVAVANDGDGFVSTGGSGRLIANVAVDNTLNGLAWDQGGEQLTIANTVSLNGGNGILAVSANADRLLANRVVGNGDAGIRLSSTVTEAQVLRSSAFGNNAKGGAFEDLQDDNASCGTNTWSRNHLGGPEQVDSGVTTSAACVE